MQELLASLQAQSAACNFKQVQIACTQDITCETKTISCREIKPIGGDSCSGIGGGSSINGQGGKECSNTSTTNKDHFNKDPTGLESENADGTNRDSRTSSNSKFKPSGCGVGEKIYFETRHRSKDSLAGGLQSEDTNQDSVLEELLVLLAEMRQVKIQWMGGRIHRCSVEP